MLRTFLTLGSSKGEEHNPGLADLEHLVCTSVLEGCWEKRHIWPFFCSGNTLRRTWQREGEEDRSCGSEHMFFSLTEGLRQLFTRGAR